MRYTRSVLTAMSIDSLHVFKNVFTFKHVFKRFLPLVFSSLGIAAVPAHSYIKNHDQTLTPQSANASSSESLIENTQTRPFTKKRFIIKYKETAPQTEESLSDFESQPFTLQKKTNHLRVKRLSARPQNSKLQIFEMEDGASEEEIAETLASLSSDPNVEYVEEDILMRPMFLPNDEHFSLQWSLFDPNAGINMIPTWDLATGKNVVVAVLDTGYLFHADYQNNLVGPGFDFISDPDISLDGDGRDNNALDEGDADLSDDCGLGATPSSWHGSHVAGTIAASTDNGIGIAGIAFDARILPVRILGKCGGFSSDIADAVTWSSGGEVAGVPSNPTPAHVINMSLGGQAPCSSALQEAITNAIARGTTVVVASGNDAVNADLFSPANCEGVITVAATNIAGDRASYSNFGDRVDLAAPGGEQHFTAETGILSTINDGISTPGRDAYGFYVGTSMAAPSVAAVAALMYELDPTITPERLRTIMMNSTSDFVGECSGCGVGFLDANQTINTLLELLRITSPPLADDRGTSGDNSDEPSLDPNDPNSSNNDSNNDIPLQSAASNRGGAFFLNGYLLLACLMLLGLKRNITARSLLTKIFPH